MTHTRRVRPSPADDGIATVWAAAGVAIIMGALLVGLYLGGAIAARHRAEAAADLAALAAAGLAVQGRDAACDRAGDIASAMGGEVMSCQLSGWDALVQVRIAVPMALVGADAAVGRARAGPADTDPPPPAGEEASAVGVGRQRSSLRAGQSEIVMRIAAMTSRKRFELPPGDP